MASMKEINLRIKSITGTKQITKAMELVAISKLTKAMDKITKCRPFYTQLYAQLCDIAATSSAAETVYCIKRPVKRVCLIVIAGDRGLAGGYNNNLFKYADELMKKKSCEIAVLPIGRRSVDHFKRRDFNLISEDFAVCEDIEVGDCFEISRLLTDMYVSGEFDEIHVVFTNFASMLSQEPGSLRLLPLASQINVSDGKTKPEYKPFMLIEPSAGEVFASIVPDSLAGLIWGAVCEAHASELAARRIAMENATDNAEEIIGELRLKYNKARKSSITQQITEIVSGSQVD